MNITKFHKIPTGGQSDSKSIVFPKIGLLYNKGVEIALFRFPDSDTNFPIDAFVETVEGLSDNAKIIFHGTFDGTNYVDNEKGKSISELKLNIFKDDTTNIVLGDNDGEAVSILLDLNPEAVISIAGTALVTGEDSYKFAAIMNGTFGYGYCSPL